MGKKKGEENPKSDEPKEGRNLLGKPKFKPLENGRFKCVETGHELPAHARDAYAESKHCRLGLINAALAKNKPPLNMFRQDPVSSSKLECKLTGLTINKSEEHIWKHMNGKLFLNMLEKLESGEIPCEAVEKPDEEKEKKKKEKEDGSLKKKDKKKKKKKKKNKNKKEEKSVDEIVNEVRDSADKSSDTEEEEEEEEAEFWMPLRENAGTTMMEAIDGGMIQTQHRRMMKLVNKEMKKLSMKRQSYPTGPSECLSKLN